MNKDVEPSETRRLFIALDLPLNVCDRLSDVQDRLRQVDVDRVIHWSANDGIHLTLKFLGDVPTEQISTIAESLAAAAHQIAPFDLSAENISAFPGPAAPQVIWAGIGGDVKALVALRSAVESAIAPLGYPTESRLFSPHLTLGRTRPNARRNNIALFGRRLSELDVGLITSWHASAVHLMQSDLHPNGAVYTSLAEWPFAAPSAD